MTFAEQILEALGDVGTDLVDMSEKQRFPGSVLRRTLPVAACAALLLTGALVANRYLTGSVSVPQAPAYSMLTAEQPVCLSGYSSVCAEGTARQTNLKLACAALNGCILQPGEIFSFNDTVGERTAEKGYLEAGAYDDKSEEGQLGGGIGQVASMLYCAALKLDLEQVERAANTYAVSYVPMGFDAAVYWDVTDYRFRNSLQTPVEIRAFVENDQVTVELWGEAEEAVRIDLTSVPVEENAVETYQVFLDEQGNVLREEYIGLSRYDRRK